MDPHETGPETRPDVPDEEQVQALLQELVGYQRLASLLVTSAGLVGVGAAWRLLRR